MTETVLDRIVGAIKAAAESNSDVRAAPVALLWPDETAQWQHVVERIAAYVPLVSLGEYEPASRRGPAYWIRCVIAGTIDAGLEQTRPVVVYLPGVPRSAVRAVEDCPPELAPIAELQYRGQWFANPKGRDWTVRALLSDAERGVGLDVAEDADSNAALLLALHQLLGERVDGLRTQRLDADFCNQLVNPDPPNILLRWLGEPTRYRGRLDAGQWSAFVQQCRTTYHFDPERDGEVEAARKLGARQGAWDHVWTRFARTPQLYPGIPEQLRKARPDELFADHTAAWPQDNEHAEEYLRSCLQDLAALTADGARTQVAVLDAEHASRRRTVWADLGHAPLAFALEHLAALAERTTQPLIATDLVALTADYTTRGWRADDAFLRALAVVRGAADRAAVAAAGRAMYRPWVDAGAKAMQSIIGPMANSTTYAIGEQASAGKGVVSVFVDGLRLDVAHRVQDRLAAVGLDVDLTTGLAALPTVTQTGKAALVPVAKNALAAGSDLYASNAATGTRASIEVLRSLMAANGVQVLGPTENGDPTGSAWTEVGEIDHRGHDMGRRLVDHLDEEVGRIVGRIRELLDAGWPRVDVLTDHGWVLLPGGLDKVDLPAATAEVK